MEVDTDPPDFEFEYQGKFISIEHTRYFNSGGEKIKAKKNLQKELINKTFDLYNLSNNPPITVGFVFEHHINLKQNEINTYCENLCKFILNNVPEEFNNKGALSIETGLPNFLRRLSFIKYSFEYSYWQSYGAYKVGDLNYLRLDFLIQKKSKDVNRYSKGDYASHWLLVVIESEEYSNYSQFDLIKFREELMTENKFERIYLAAMRHRPDCIRIK